MLRSQVMLFCEYPFERPEDADNRHRFTIVLERVLNVQYTIPAGMPLPPLACSSMLLFSPIRLTFARVHDWQLLRQVEVHLPGTVVGRMQ